MPIGLGPTFFDAIYTFFALFFGFLLAFLAVIGAAPAAFFCPGRGGGLCPRTGLLGIPVRLGLAGDTHHTIG
jgi:hypothetical protein